jgi:hypothetical protein
MRAISPVLPHNPDYRETILAEDQKEYSPLPVCRLLYSGSGVITTVSHYKLTWRERIRILIRGSLWIEQMTFGQPLQPQRPTVFEPLTKADIENQCDFPESKEHLRSKV